MCALCIRAQIRAADSSLEHTHIYLCDIRLMCNHFKAESNRTEPKLRHLIHCIKSTANRFSCSPPPANEQQQHRRRQFLLVAAAVQHLANNPANL